MIYRDFKGQKLSQLGFGCMRFASDPETGEIDQTKVNAMFDLAISEGVNYFDTAYPYLGGKSETAMAEALSRYPRDSYYIADKFPGHSLTAPIDNIALFNVSLRKCGRTILTSIFCIISPSGPSNIMRAGSITYSRTFFR